MTTATLPFPSAFAFRWGAWPLWAASWKMSARGKLLAISICDGIFWSQTLRQLLRVVPSSGLHECPWVFIYTCVFVFFVVVNSYLKTARLIWQRFHSRTRLSSFLVFIFSLSLLLLLPRLHFSHNSRDVSVCTFTYHHFPFHFQFCDDLCLSVGVYCYINSICVQCAAHRIETKRPAQSFLQIGKINSR